MNRAVHFIILLSIVIFLTACSNNSTDISNEKAEDQRSGAMVHESEMNMDNAVENDAVEEKALEQTDELTSDRMIIHQAQLQINVKDLDQTQLNIEKKVKEYGGYIVESNVYRNHESSRTGELVIRIPENHFQVFLNDTEAEAANVLERNVTGQDVTEQYVDLESRLKSKRKVEERLLDFMDSAKKTEDLLKISNDLSKVQEEIEVIVGKMKYLENQTSFSTITIVLYEDRIPEIDSKNLNTWEKVKKQFAASTNFLLAAGSGLVVFLLGNLPVIMLFLVIVLVIYMFFKRRNTRG